MHNCTLAISTLAPKCINLTKPSWFGKLVGRQQPKAHGTYTHVTSMSDRFTQTRKLIMLNDKILSLFISDKIILSRMFLFFNKLVSPIFWILVKNDNISCQLFISLSKMCILDPFYLYGNSIPSYEMYNLRIS